MLGCIYVRECFVLFFFGGWDGDTHTYTHRHTTPQKNVRRTFLNQRTEVTTTPAASMAKIRYSGLS